MPISEDNNATPVSLRRRFGAIVYDLIALIAVLFFGTLPIVIALDGEAIAAENPFYFLYLFACAFFYFGFCWTRGGQTLGMSAWKIKLLTSTGSERVSTANALKRFLLATFSLGLGLLSAAFRKDRRTWYDVLSGTHLESTKR